MPELETIGDPRIGERLFRTPERWGWEFQDPGEPQKHRDVDRRPQLSPVFGPDIYDPQVTYDKAKESAVQHGAIVGVLALVGLASLGQPAVGIVLILAAAGLGAFWFVPMMNASQQIAERKAEHERAKRAEAQKHAQAVEQWTASIQKWDQAERERIDAAMEWFPLQPRSETARLEVFGGTPEGWSSFLTTMGSGVLQEGDRLTVVDLSESDVGHQLELHAEQRGFPMRRQELPRQLDQAQLLQGLGAESVAEIVAEAMHTRRINGDLSPRLIDADILKGIASRLDAPISFAKLAAALRILQGNTGDLSDALLSGREIQAIAGYVDQVGDSDRMLSQIQELRSTLESLLEGTSAEPVTPEEPTSSGLTLLVTDDHNARRRDIVDRLIVQALVHRLRQDRGDVGGQVLVIAGADHLGMDTLEALGRAARRADVRLFLLIEHLREEYEPFLGGSDSSAIFMRMGNSREAARAAEHIGRGHSFQLAQLSRQKGTTQTQGTSTSTGTSETISNTTGTSDGKAGRGTSQTHGVSTGTSTQYGTNESVSTSVNDGVTHSRVYEFTVEPTRFQDLDPNAFILVQPLTTGGRRVAAGTCDPQVVTLPRVSDIEFEDGRRPSTATPIQTN